MAEETVTEQQQVVYLAHPAVMQPQVRELRKIPRVSNVAPVSSCFPQTTKSLIFQLLHG